MSSSLLIESDERMLTQAAPLAPVARTARPAREHAPVAPELAQSLVLEESGLRREVLLWQRWLRYLALGAMGVFSMLFSAAPNDALLSLGAVALVYVTVVMATTHVLQHASPSATHAWIPPVLLAADSVAVATFVYLTSTPDHQDRILLIGLLSTQLAVFYFGRAHGLLAAALSAVSYLLLANGMSAFVAGPKPTPQTIAFTMTLYTTVSAVLVYTFGGFRERMDALRAYCKVVEQGDGAALPRLGGERWPDDLTLLARSFQAMHSRLAEQVGSDPLTGCLNRRALETELRADLRQARRRGSTVAVAAIDLDHFKEINDSRGHPVGDIVLQQLAGIMRATARDSDAVARFGGDEFVIVLPDTSWHGALMFAERLRQSVDEHEFGPPDIPLEATISIGVALASGTDSSSADILLKEADAALYRAKSAGRNRVFS